MKKLFLLLPILALMVGCKVVIPDHSTVTMTDCPLMGRAYGTTGATQYTCDRLACDEDAFTFSCQFTNVSNRVQPGVSLRIGMFSETTGFEVLRSETIFANSLKPGQTDTRVIRWSKAKVSPVCGPALDKCVFLTDRVWPR